MFIRNAKVRIVTIFLDNESVVSDKRYKTAALLEQRTKTLSQLLEEQYE